MQRGNRMTERVVTSDDKTCRLEFSLTRLTLRESFGGHHNTPPHATQHSGSPCGLSLAGLPPKISPAFWVHIRWDPRRRCCRAMTSSTFIYISVHRRSGAQKEDSPSEAGKQRTVASYLAEACNSVRPTSILPTESNAEGKWRPYFCNKSSNAPLYPRG